MVFFLCEKVTTVISYFQPLAEGAIGSASKTLNSKQQMSILDLTKTVAESALQYMYAVKEGGGNPKVNNTAVIICCGLNFQVTRKL